MALILDLQSYKWGELFPLREFTKFNRNDGLKHRSRFEAVLFVIIWARNSETRILGMFQLQVDPKEGQVIVDARGDLRIVMQLSNVIGPRHTIIVNSRGFMRAAPYKG
jgi:hypothetical protein